MSLVLLCTTLDARAGQSPAPFQQPRQSGRRVTVTGVVTVLYADDFAQRRAELVQIIRDDRTGRSFRLRSEAGPLQHLRSGSRVTVQGRQEGSIIYLAAQGGTLTQESGASALLSAPVSGNQATLVIVANFSDKVLDPFVPGADCSSNAISDFMFTSPTNYSVDDLYQDASGGRVSFSGTVVGPFTLPYAGNSACDLSAWSSAADAAALGSGVDPSAYPRKVYVMPTNLCGGAGIGEVGVTPSRAWVFACDVPHVYAHELGHNLAMNHASTLSDEYGDESDPMAMSGMLKGFNAVHKVQTGWLVDTQVTAVAQDGTFQLAPLALDPTLATSTQVLSAPRPGTADRYYVSYRHGTTGFEGNVYSQYLDRVSVHRWAGGMNNTYLLAVLDAGQSYTDPATGFAVAVVSRTDSAATVQVTLGAGCGSAAPLVTLSPGTQSGPAGSTALYDLTVTNNDAAGCPVTNFVATANVPSGWLGSLSSGQLQLLPGATGQVTLALTTSTGASGGTYGVTTSVSDGVIDIHNASATASYAVLTGDALPPSAPSNLAARVKSRRVYLSWSAATDNVGVTGYRIWRDGNPIAWTASASWIDGSVGAGTYTYWVVAYDAAGNMSAPSNSAIGQISTSSGRSK